MVDFEEINGKPKTRRQVHKNMQNSFMIKHRGSSGTHSSASTLNRSSGLKQDGASTQNLSDR
eukprot:2379332-Amphidinium_carterae.1